MEALGKPVATLSLVGSSEKAPPSSCRLWLSIDTLYGLRCEAGAIKLVSLATADGRPIAIQDRFSGTIASTDNMKSQLGDYCVTAELWPSQKLRNGTAAVSSALGAMLGSSSPGSIINLYQLFNKKESMQQCSLVRLQLCSKAADVDAASLSHRSSSDAPEEAFGNGEPSSSARALPNPATPLQRGRTGSMQASHATPPSMRGSAALQVTPNLLGLPSKEATRSSTGKKSGKDRKQRDGDNEIGIGNNGARRVDRSISVQLKVAQDLLKGQLDDKLCDVLEVLATQTLQGRFILPGNIVTLPLLGLNIQLISREIDGEPGNPSQITAGTTVKIITASASSIKGENNMSKVPPYVNLVKRAVADAVGEEDDGPAVQAAFQAAIVGARSLGSSLANLGGLQAQIEVLRQTVIAPLRGYEKFAAHSLFPPPGVLFHGPPGTGKTALARAAANDANAAFFVINGPDIVSEYLGESESCLKGIFAAARALAPAVIFIDEIDALAPSRGGSAGQGSSQSPVSVRLVTTLLKELDSVKGHAVVVLAATNRVKALDESLRRPGRLDKEIEVAVPNAKDRLDILRKMLLGIRHSLDDADIVGLAEEAHGFVGADISALCSEAAMAALRRAIEFGEIKSCLITIHDFNYAKSIVRPSALRELVLEIPQVKWEDIGGNEDAKQQLKEIVEWPRMFQDSLSRIGANPPRGVLLYGPPGCSKTLLAKAVAREANMNFMAIKGPELFSTFVGESEKALHNVFEKARASCPSIIFFDEIDGMIGSRTDGASGGAVHVGERVLSQLLQEMDGLQSAASDLIVMAATNRPDCLDPALLRPGRFDRLLYLAPPDTQARVSIFQIHTKAMPTSQVDLRQLAQATGGYSGADIAAVCQQAALIALESDDTAVEVSMEHFYEAIHRVVPNVLENADKQLYDSFRRRVR